MATLRVLVPRYYGVELAETPAPTVRFTVPDSPWRRHLVHLVKLILEDAGADVRTVGAPGEERLEIAES